MTEETNGNGSHRTPTNREALVGVGTSLDENTKLLRTHIADFKQFRDAIQGVPGISLGALGEIRQSQKILEERFDVMQHGLGAAIDASVTTLRDKEFRQRFSRGAMWIASIASSAVGAIVASIILLLVGHH